ncbi:Uncharacterised protein [Chryseobacterium gleum]|uniref:Uncharacterized protein n=2 Tax=Chryseobacterium gleum TaxID=250 RepID=A0A3S4N6E5_CHRGE|nr:hypothetical protein [Chryseobacterium gleum]EFK36888.1 hypothetical protein HMPREF0204_11445 [Chryseobacterium gleum ATCC 35910]QBJ88083.1 hypothetical protein DDI74_18340 [Chryseobacterium gleum]QQY32133.1 hypothetical protein I6I60_25435 [Chryseobacterium gleum]VEE10639.1 Uncharacterised protein [Chryseobacterium gleum]
METSNFQKILNLFKKQSDNYLCATIYNYLNSIDKLEYILIDKNKANSIYTVRNEINNTVNESLKIQGYDDLLNNLNQFDNKKVIISNFDYNKKDFTIFINDKETQILGILWRDINQ